MVRTILVNSLPAKLFWTYLYAVKVLWDTFSAWLTKSLAIPALRFMPKRNFKDNHLYFITLILGTKTFQSKSATGMCVWISCFQRVSLGFLLLKSGYF